MVDPTGPIIPALPVTYRGELYRSTLEADWAATFDTWGWFHLHEPIAVQVDGHGYLIDFELPHQGAWAEVKGPHNIGVEKTYTVAEFFHGHFDSFDDLGRPLIVILEPSHAGAARWREAHPLQQIVITLCGECGQYAFMDYNGIWACRYGCRNGGENKFWCRAGGGLFFSGELPFSRAWAGPR